MRIEIALAKKYPQLKVVDFITKGIVGNFLQ